MPEAGLLTSKVRAYMEQLSPAARAMLVRSLRSAPSDGDVPSDLILAAVEGLEIADETALVAGTHHVAQGEPWSDRLERAFLTPLAPFLCDDDAGTAFTGRIPRAHVSVLWTWIRRDVASDAWERALAADPLDADADAAPIARKFRREAVPKIVEVLRDTASDPKPRQKLTGHLGGENVYRTLLDVSYVLQNESAFANVFGQLPTNVTSFDVAEPSRIAEIVRASIEQVQMTPEWIAAAILTRTNNPVVVAQLACRLAGTTDARLVASSRFSPLVDIVIARLELHAALAGARGSDPTSRNRFLADLCGYHELAKTFELVFPVESVSAWFRRLGAARGTMSEAVSRRIETAPGLVRRALRVETSVDGYAGRFDLDAYEDAEFAVRAAIEARLAADTLAVNELVVRTRKQLEQTLEVVSGKLMNDLKTSQVRDRSQLVDAVDGAIRLCALVFGEDYAAVMRKSRDNALQRPTRAVG